ncbi:Tlr 5Rp protein [Reticulomyxa filosa]|uniref:Tlr 5Rp protein n=1 Tax=Reticulomyxa filosa TaxID=46433 RepID=X6LC84_RETFI|nr:Tlr 5Rp protein [Reticulomyxa filosa]|eukprot:ETN98339.1 Tlr 5Rp protein [Reticulomyxa filosa]
MKDYYRSDSEMIKYIKQQMEKYMKKTTSKKIRIRRRKRKHELSFDESKNNEIHDDLDNASTEGNTIVSEIFNNDDTNMFQQSQDLLQQIQQSMQQIQQSIRKNQLMSELDKQHQMLMQQNEKIEILIKN